MIVLDAAPKRSRGITARRSPARSVLSDVFKPQPLTVELAKGGGTAAEDVVSLLPEGYNGYRGLLSVEVPA